MTVKRVVLSSVVCAMACLLLTPALPAQDVRMYNTAKKKLFLKNQPAFSIT